MTGWDLLARGWEFEPSVVAGSAGLLGGYLGAVHFRLNRTTMFFAAGVMVMFLALVSPLDDLGDNYLFSAHMLQHMLLDLVAPPLFVLGLPENLARRVLSWRPADLLERTVGHPVVAWLLGIGTFSIWHLPSLYDAALANETVHVFEHLTFLATGTILFWPVLNRLPERRLAPLQAVVYLGLAATANSVLGIIFTFASKPFYDGYDHARDPLGARRLIRQQWGLDRITDQQLGGACMWVLGGLVFLGPILKTISRWYREEEEEVGCP